jgi:hypothetical protein
MKPSCSLPGCIERGSGVEKANPKPATLILSFGPDSGPLEELQPVRRFFPILQQGFSVSARVGCSIRDLLCQQFGLEPDYLKHRITTIFLNGKAIDDPEKSRVADGCTLALSAAMPGLVGATMRAGGYYAAMRGAMTHQEMSGSDRQEIGRIRIKLFNLLMAELGPGFLAHGIIIPARELAEFLADQPSASWEGWRQAVVNGKPVEPDPLAAKPWEALGDEPVRLIVTFEE